MDELVIADKRYISARRAAREHHYHSDYIGQLIRAGKVVGQKVGRSWYVEEGSLLDYLNGEVSTPVLDSIPEEKVMPVAAVQNTGNAAEEEIQPSEITSAPQEIVEESVKEPAAQEPVEDPIEEKVEIEKEPEHKVTVHVSQIPPAPYTGGLAYVSEESLDENQSYEETPEEAVVSEYPPARSGKKFLFRRVLAIVVVGGAVFGGSVVLGQHLSATVALVDGQTASVGYTLQW